MRGKSVLLTILLVMAAVLAGCSSKEAATVGSTRYQEYINNIMECSYYGETAKYVEVCDATEQEAKEVHDSTVEYYALELMDFNSVDPSYISDELYDEYVELAREIMSKVKFTVNKANKVNDEWQVKIEIQPIDFNDITYDPIEELIEKFNANIEGVDTTQISDEQWAEIEESYAQEVYDVLKEYVSQIGYKDTVSKIVIISVDEEGYYGITDDEWNDIDDLVVDMDY